MKTAFKLFGILVVFSIPTRDVSAATCSKIADIAFVVDSSSSIWEPYFKMQIRFIHDILTLFEISPSKTRVAAVSFSSVINHEFNFNSYDSKDKVLEAVSRIKYTKGDATRTYKALEHMNDVLFQPSNGARNDVVQIAIVMTDGGTNPGGHDNNISLQKAKVWTQREAQQARDAGIFVFAIGIGSAVDVNELNGIASDPDSNFMIKVPMFQDLNKQTLKNLIAYRTCEVNNKPTEPPTLPPTNPPTTPKPQNEQPKKECKGMIADVIFIIDESSSLDTQKNFNLELNFVSNIVNNMDIASNRTRVGVIAFADEPRTIFNLKDFTTKEDVITNVNSISWQGGNTFTDSALQLLLTDSYTPANGGRSGVPKVAVVITDGNSTNPYMTEKVSQKVQDNGIHVFAIGVGTPYLKELNYIASNPNENYVFTVNSLNALDTIKEDLSINVCKNPQSDEPKDVCPGKRADIVIIADSSTSIGPTDFQKQLNFLNGVINNFDIGPDNVQVGMITFSTNATKQFPMNRYSSKADLQAAIKQVTWVGGLTFTNKALQMMLEEGFSAVDGARRGVPKICIVITDGWSRIPKETERLAKKAKGGGITMFSIGVGTYIVQEELEKIASSPPDTYSFRVTDFNALAAIENSLAARTCGSGKKGTKSARVVPRPLA